MRVNPIRATLPLAALVACGSGAEPAGPPATLTAVTAGPFVGTVGIALPELQVRVEDANGRPVDGVAVRFAVASGSGSIGIATIGGASYTDTTDAAGVATAAWTLGTRAGEQRASARVTDVAAVEFAAVAQAGAPSTSEIHESSAFITAAGAATDEPLAIRIADVFGNPVAGTPVTWAALAAGASVGAATTTSDSAGIARVDATVGATTGLYLFRGTPLNLPPDTIGVLAVTIVSDPEGDQAPEVDPAFASHDVTRFGALVLDGVLVLYAKFARPVGPNLPGAGAREALIANYDFDTDGDTLTGYITLRQCLGGAPLNFGADAFVDLDPASGFLAGQNAPPGAVAVLRVDSLLGSDRCAASFNGSLFASVPAYQPTSVSLGIPLTFLRDDGVMAITNLFGHPSTGVTDVVPDSAAWEFTPTAVAGALRLAAPGDVWRYLPVSRPDGVERRVEGARIRGGRVP